MWSVYTHHDTPIIVGNYKTITTAVFYASK